MNANQLLNMIVRTVVRRMVNGGINKGIDLASKGRADPQKPLTPQEKAQQKANANDLKKKSKLFRKIGRF